MLAKELHKQLPVFPVGFGKRLRGRQVVIVCSGAFCGRLQAERNQYTFTACRHEFVRVCEGEHIRMREGGREAERVEGASLCVIVWWSWVGGFKESTAG